MRREILYLLVAAGTAALALVPALDYPLDPRLTLYAAGFGALWTGLRLGHFLNAWQRWHRWSTSPSWSFGCGDLPFESSQRLLPGCLARALYRGLPARLAAWLYPDRGILLGRAFQWTPQHTQSLESYMRDGGRPLPTAADLRGGHPALHAVGIRKERPLVLPWSELVGHVLIGGTTRSGKTRLLEVILAEAIRGPGTVIVLDPKGDADLLRRAADEAARHKRPFAFFSPAYPQESSSFNPFGTCKTPSELAARVQALMPGGGAMARDPFFTEYPLAIIERLGEAQKAVGEDWTIEGLNAVTTLVPPFESLIAAYLGKVVLQDGGAARSLAALIEAYEQSGRRDLLADALLDDYRKPRDHFQKVTANLTPAFRGVIGPQMGPLLSNARPDLTWDGIVAARTVVYFSMNSLMFGEVANRIGRVILQDLIGFLGRRYAYENPARMSPVTIVIDEFSNVAYPGFIDALNKGGGARAQFLLAMQSLADPAAAMGRDGAQRVLDNLNTRIWFRLTDDHTAKLATEGLGLTNVSHMQVGYSLGFGGAGGLTGSVGGGLQHAEKPLIRPEWLTAMPRGEALVRLKGENWKLRVPLFSPVSPRRAQALARAFRLGKALSGEPGDPPGPKADRRQARAAAAEKVSGQPVAPAAPNAVAPAAAEPVAVASVAAAMASGRQEKGGGDAEMLFDED